ncbi:DUF4435 domain-containing protein [Streptomyces sp. NPDC002886]|uniref:DUF4435 domain-containing protein n=1 Tax=Streptomyces sp. NPDC002886 TaxID=3364667 RepID=UPI0036C05649
MREYISSTTIANEVSMLRTTMSGPIVLLEGVTDSRLYRRFFLPSPHVRSIFCDGKPNLLDAMSKIRRGRVAGVAAICDADYDRLLGISRGEDVCFTDLHDAETMISYSAAFRRVVEELVDREVVDEEVQKIRDALVDIACVIGEIRVWSIQSGLSLKFADVDAGSYLLQDGTFDLEGYISRVLEGSSSGVVDVGEAMSVAGGRKFRNFGIEVATGHDFCSLLAADISFRVQGAADKPTLYTVEAMLRLSFDAECFAQTDLARLLDDWQTRNDLDLLADAALPAGA